MIAIFRNNLFFNSLLLLPYLFVIRIHSLLYPVSFIENESTSFLSETIFGFVGGPLSQNIIACIFLFIQSILINRIAIQNRLSRVISLIPGLFYAIFCSFSPQYSFLSDYLIANTFVILSISEVMKAYHNPRSVSNVFNAGLFLGLAIALVPQYSTLSLFGFLAVIVLNSINIYNILQYIAGIITILTLIFGIEYLIDVDIIQELALFKTNYNSLLFTREVLLSVPVLLSIALFAVTILGYNSYAMKKSIQSQKKIDLLYYFMLSVLISVVFSHDVAISHILIFFIPISILTTLSFLDIKSNLIAELIHLVFLGLLFSFHFGLLAF